MRPTAEEWRPANPPAGRASLRGTDARLPDRTQMDRSGRRCCRPAWRRADYAEIRVAWKWLAQKSLRSAAGTSKNISGRTVQPARTLKTSVEPAEYAHRTPKRRDEPPVRPREHPKCQRENRYNRPEHQNTCQERPYGSKDFKNTRRDACTASRLQKLRAGHTRQPTRTSKTPDYAPY